MVQIHQMDTPSRVANIFLTSLAHTIENPKTKNNHKKNPKMQPKKKEKKSETLDESLA